VLLAVVAAVIAVIRTAPDSVPPPTTGRLTHAIARKIPPYWTVRPGDTFSEISQRTGLTLAELQAYNRDVDPESLEPGQRLNLWAHPPVSRPPPPGPLFWTVRPGQSFGSIAASTGKSLAVLEQLNPALKPANLQPGDRVRLRH
jgi:LysM repeat protein